MARKKISELNDGGLFTAGDQLLIARSGQNYKIDGAQIANTVANVANTVARLDALEGAEPDPSLPPGGSTGQILAKSSPADGDAAWIDAPIGGGGGGASIIPIKPPVLADFTVNGGKGFSSATATPTFVSFRRNYNGDSGAQLGAYKGVPLTGPTWEATAILQIPLLNAGGQGLNGIAVRENTGKIYEFGIDMNSGSPQFAILRMTDTVTFGSSAGTLGGLSRLDYFTIRIRKTATFYYFDFSPDFGTTWVNIQGYALNDFLTSSDSVGVVMQTYGFTSPDSLVCPYWDLKYT